MILRHGLFPTLLLALTAGCAPSSSESARSADNGQPVATAVAAQPDTQTITAPGNAAGTVSLVTEPANVAELAPASDRSLDLPPSKDATQPAPFPDEVTAFMVDRDGCDHFRGEEPYDAERRAYLEESIAELCTGADAKLAALRRRYERDPAVIAALGGYEDRIESPGEE